MKKIFNISVLILVYLLFCNQDLYSQTDKQSTRLKYLSYVFPADSLSGFNEVGNSNAALSGGFFGIEYKIYMYRAKRNYINKKYHYSPPPSMDSFKGSTPVINAAPCVNEDFEASPLGQVGATLSGWIISQGQNTSSCTMGGCCPTAGGLDAYIRNTPYVTGQLIGTIPASPLGGTKILQMNDFVINIGECVRIEQTFPVTSTNALFQLAYMAQMDGSGHACCDQPYLKVTMLNCTNVPLACPSLSVNAPGASCASSVPAGWTTNSSGISWTTAWQMYSLDLTPYLGSCVTIQITASDCTGWGHHGMAFVDCLCSPMTINVNNIPFPVGTAATVSVSACSLGTATVSAPPGLSPYTWNGPPGSGVTNNPNQTFTTTMAGNYTLTMNPPGSCTPIVRIVNLSFAAAPVAGFTTVNSCNSYTITNTGSASPSSQTYSFTGPGAPPSFTTTNATSSITFPAAGTFTITQTITNTVGCTASVQAVVNVPAGPNPALTTPTWTQCLTGNSFVFTATQAAGTHTYNFNPTVGAPASSNANPYGPVSFTAPGTYTITHILTNAGCTATTNSLIVINPDPVVTANNTSPVCTGGNVAFSCTPGGGTYSWTGPNSFASAVQNPTLTGATTAAAGVYTINVTVLGCTGVATTTVVISTPTAAANNTGPYCAGQTIQLNGSAPGTYTWTGPPAYNGSGQNPAIPNSAPAMSGTYNFTVDLGGCFANGSTNVTVNPLPTPVANSNSPFCAGNPLNLTGSAAATYTWNGPNSFQSNLQNPTIPIAQSNAQGTYTLTVIDGNNCTNSVTTVVVISPNPQLLVNNPTLCENSTINLTATAGGATYAWVGPLGFTSSAQNPIIPNSNLGMSGAYSVTLTTAAGCSNTAVANVIINPAPVPTINSNSPICLNDVMNLTAGGGITYSWSGPNGFFSSVQSPTVLASSTSVSGIYQVTVTDANTCSASTTINAVVNPLPVPQITSGPNVGCAPLCVTYTVQSIPTASTAYWTFGNGESANGVLNSIACYNAPGIYTINATVVDVNGCMASATWTAEVYPKPTADFNHAPIKPIINIDGDVVFTDASWGAPIVSWNWYFMNTAQYTSVEQNPTFLYTEPGNYVVALVVKSDKGCSDTLLRPLVVGEDFGIYVPNAFTPNNDEWNNVFQPKGFGIVKYELHIFDRWGEKVFHTKEFTEGWDGTFQGRGTKICKEDVYTWLITCTDVFGKSHELKGHVTLIR